MLKIQEYSLKDSVLFLVTHDDGHGSFFEDHKPLEKKQTWHKIILISRLVLMLSDIYH